MDTGVLGPPVFSLLPVSVLRGRRSVGAAQAVGHDQRGMAGQIGDHELLAECGRDDDVDLLKQRRDLLDGERPGAHGLDVFDRGIEARDAESVGPVVFALLGEESVAAASWSGRRRRRRLRLEHRRHGAVGQVRQLHRDQVTPIAFSLSSVANSNLRS